MNMAGSYYLQGIMQDLAVTATRFSLKIANADEVLDGQGRSELKLSND